MATISNRSEVVAANVRRLRRAREWTLNDLSARLDEVGYPLSMKLLSKTENGDRGIGADEIYAFSQAFEVNVATLFVEPILPPGVPELVERLDRADRQITQARTDLQAARQAAESAQRSLDSGLEVRSATEHQIDMLAESHEGGWKAFMDLVQEQHGDAVAGRIVELWF
jgi:transcriptional regulator with XRE-family HTH domain